MGSYRSKNFKVDVDSLPTLEPEPNYEIKTRSPMPDRWALNILRGQREDELKGLAYAYARYFFYFYFLLLNKYNKRRKCRKHADEFIDCERRNGSFWTVFEC